jgi:hypothetical protein
MYGKFDVGPAVFEFFARCTIILCLTLIRLKKHPQRALFALVFLSILGMFNKLSFIWFLNSILPVFILLQLLLSNPKSRKAFFSENYKTFIIILGTWLLAIIWFIAIYKINQLDPTINSDPALFGQSIGNKFLGISYLIQNVGIYSNFLHQPIPFPSIPFLYFNLITFFSGSIYYLTHLVRSRMSNSQIDTPHFMAILLLCSTLIILIQIIITPAATNPWHFFCLFPSLLLFLILSWIHILQGIKKYIIIHKLLCGLLVSSMLLYGILINAIVYDKIKSVAPQTRSWERLFSTTTNDAFLEYLKNHPRIHFNFLDWGMHTLAITLLPEPRFREYLGCFQLDKISIIPINAEELFVTHSLAASAFPKIRPAFFDYLDRFGFAYTLVHKIDDTDGLTVFEFWKISKSKTIGINIFNLNDKYLNLFHGHACTINADLDKNTLQIDTTDIDPIVVVPEFNYPDGAHDYVVRVEIFSSVATTFRLFPQTVAQPQYGFNIATEITPGDNYLFLLLPNYELAGRLRIDPGEKPGRYIFKSISVSLIKPEKQSMAFHDFCSI